MLKVNSGPAAVILACGVLLAGCAGLQDTAPPQPQAPVLPPEPLVCPEPPPCQCPEPEKIVVPTPVPQPCPKQPRELQVFGGIEWVRVGDKELKAKARIDTGAKTSSLHAEDVIEFERDGKRWVRFSFNAEEGQPAESFEEPVVRRVLIKRHGEEVESQRRYVVKLMLAIGPVRELVEVTLNDRSDFEYPVLIGRNFLTDNAVVDVAKKYNAR